MRNRRTLQTLILAAALTLGLTPDHFNGLSVLAILLAASVFLLQPGVLRRTRRPVLRLVK